MKRTSRLYHDLLRLLKQSDWADQRHLQTLVWMVLGLICAGCVNLTQWTAYTQSRAKIAQSHQRRFSRWLHNSRINVHRLYSPIIKQSLRGWGESVIVLIIDTSMLWNRYCLIRVSVQYRGRAIPVSWRVISHQSSSIDLKVYQGLLKRAAHLMPPGVSVRFLADRGFADTKLMSYLTQELGWHYRIRLKEDCWVIRQGKRACQLKDFHLSLGEALLLGGVQITKTNPYGLVHLALANDPISGEHWYIVSDEPTTLQTLHEYSQRFDIEEEFLDEKSNGFQLESSGIRSSIALSRLCLVLAIATLFLSVQGQQVVAHKLRRLVDCHWHRGNSYLRLGWDWVRGVLHKGWKLFVTLQLSGQPDPSPARASRKQLEKHYRRVFTVQSYHYAF